MYSWNYVIMSNSFKKYIVGCDLEYLIDLPISPKIYWAPTMYQLLY